MSTEMYKRLRPRKFKDVIGQDEAVSMLHGFVEDNRVPNAMLFTGPSGTGKTTLAYILRDKLNCSEQDFYEVDASKDRGINVIRSIDETVGQNPWGGDCQIWLLDEAHGMTAEAQDGLLKMLESSPDFVYFFLASTDPGKIKRTIQTRCTRVDLKLLPPKDMLILIDDVLVRDGDKVKITDAVKDRIVQCAEGSPRMALVYLNQVIGLEREEDQIKCIVKPETEKLGIDIARVLMNGGKDAWPNLQPLFKDLAEEPETVRRVVLAYATSVMLGKGNWGRANCIIQWFRDPFYGTGKTSLSELVSASFNVLMTKD